MNQRDALSAGLAAWNRLKPVKTGSSDNSDQVLLHVVGTMEATAARFHQMEQQQQYFIK